MYTLLFKALNDGFLTSVNDCISEKVDCPVAVELFAFTEHLNHPFK